MDYDLIFQFMPILTFYVANFILLFPIFRQKPSWMQIFLLCIFPKFGFVLESITIFSHGQNGKIKHDNKKESNNELV
jgi:hypothetical protein